MAVARSVNLTAGGASYDWPFGWAYAAFSASGITIQQQLDGTNWYNMQRLDSGGGDATSTGQQGFSVGLAPGVPVRATGTGTVTLLPGSAPSYSFQAEVPAA